MEKLNPKNIENILPLTPVQEGILFHYLKNPGSDFYFEQLCLDISGEIDVLHFEKAWRTVIETNEILRTVFRWEKLAKPSQIILKEPQCRLSFYNLSAENNHEKKIMLAKIKDKDRHDRFDLHGVPFRVILCKLAENKYQLIVSNHHILYDGWSTGIILKEFFKAYHGLCQGERPLRLPVKTPFKEFIKWLQNRDGHKQEQFWRNNLAGFETPAALPIKRKIKTTGGAGDHSIILAEDLKDKLNVFIKKRRVTLASVFYTAWGILLQKYGGNGDVVFGTTVSGRCGEIKGIEDMVGLFINTIPLRIRVTSYEKLHDAVFQTEKILREREPFENTPLVDIGSYSSLGSNESLFDTILAIENYPLDNRLVPGGCLLTVTSYSMNETTHYDLTVGILPFNEITINFNYKPELFAKETIENLAGHFKRILQRIIENPETVLSQLEIISAEEKNRILYEFNNTAAEYPKGKTIHELFVEQAEKTPDYIALVGAADLSYRELNEWSGKLAGLLIERGVMADSIVGIMTERSIEMVIGILGILKSGGCYLPVDPEYPQERIDYMLKDSAARILISKAEIESVSNFVRRASNSSPSNLAYLIYTSGSTGKPKGVLIRHGSVVNRLNWMQQMYPLESNDIILQKTRFTFDVSVWELFWWSFYGARLCLLGPGEEKDPAAITNSIYKNHITTMHFVPSMLNEFLSYLESSREAYRCVSLKWVFASGEALGASQVDRFDSLLEVDGECRVKLINLYGPTEATVDVSYYNCCVDHRFDTVTAPIGKPIHNIHLYVVNIDMRFQPIGIAGELCIAGVGLARGYLNKPELTSEKFKHDLWDYPDYQDEISKSFAGVAYKTGDLARWLPDGNIEFLGRIDHQVKIRGFRIELGEIESRLLKHGKIKEAVVLAKEDSSGDKYLAAYFVSDIELSDTELTEYLLKDLPDYMMPLHFVRLEKIPLTPSGKMDRKALPAPKVKEIAAYVAPRNEIEMKLAEIWAGILGRNLALDRIGIDDNFFQLGGHSLKATML
ncbi:MAG TPA: amino acid adenylation domain-containing protein, partial [Candidatus Deferrimicrobium sp.]|nr:amino acid adenylation domain-containing protein [Candidatus Deferrimicrobium sp.]